MFVLQVARLENVVGWYHSHPGYGCWLSGIDVNTQMMNQKFQEPWVAIVVGNILAWCVVCFPTALLVRLILQELFLLGR